MGQVYRATDTTLNRPVAIKILPDGFAADAERLARFEREAKTLASLNHPHIATIYTVEKSSGVHALIMELVEGDDLSQRIAHGPMPLGEALPIAKQIADALEAAHERGIVHRDLKPANIKVRPDGVVKVLDFGLAKALEPSPGSSIEATTLPTMAAQATHAGLVLGTPAYMPPEQAQGKSVDKVADVWAFGAVVYEMVTGRRAFAGSDASTTLARVIEREPDWTALPAATPPAIRRLLRRCLEKDRRRRLRDIGEARIAIEDALANHSDGEAPDRVVTRATQQRWLAVGGLMLVAGAAIALVAGRAMTDRSVPTRSQLAQFTIVPPPSQYVAINGLDSDLAIAPDGAFFVYVGGAARELMVRPLDRLEARPLDATRGARMPSISRDSRWVAFFAGEVNEVKKAPIGGGPAVALCRYEQGPRGATWISDDTLVFATSDPATGLLSVSSAGGEPRVLTRPDVKQGERDHLFPSTLPGGDAVLFTVLRDKGIENASVALLNLKTGERTALITGGSHAQYVEASPGAAQAGYIVYSASGTLRAVAFDPVTRQVRGDAVPVVERVMTMGSGAAEFAISRQGTLVYVPGGGQVGTGRSLVWLTRQGQEEPIKAPARAYTHPRLAPDDTRVALDVFDQEQDIWIWDLVRESMTRFTLDPGLDIYPTWTSDSRRLIFSSTRSGASNVYWQSADGTGTIEPLTSASEIQNPLSVTPDGAHLVVSVRTKTGSDLYQLRLDGSNHSHTPLVSTTFEEINGEISADGRWLAYQSNESGRNEVYVRPFPDVDAGRWQVSTSGGSQPLWARDGGELFFLDAGSNLMRVAVPKGSSFTPGPPAQILGTLAARFFTAGPGRTYDVSRDGQRFLMIRTGAAAEQASANIVVAMNWIEELNRLVPTR